MRGNAARVSIVRATAEVNRSPRNGRSISYAVPASKTSFRAAGWNSTATRETGLHRRQALGGRGHLNVAREV